jgi:hypothetical protein
MNDIDDPFNLGGTFVNTFAGGGGSNHSGDNLKAGSQNDVDPADTTLVTVDATVHPAFAGINTAGPAASGDGRVGVYGIAKGETRAIGVAGACAQGSGVYGICLQGGQFIRGEPLPFIQTPGIGVVGRSMAGNPVEKDTPIEKLVESSVGVLGHSFEGAGVRCHGGGPLAQASSELFIRGSSAGGVFSSGNLSRDNIPAGGETRNVLISDGGAQLQLIPSTAGSLPGSANLGDFFLAITAQQRAALWICTRVDPDELASWQEVMLGPPMTGGALI